MSVIIKKFAKSYVDCVEDIKILAKHICATIEDNSVVVIIPAMAEMTDVWIDYAYAISHNSYLREKNIIRDAGGQVAIALLSMALQELGQPAISLTKAQIGIIAEAEYTDLINFDIQTDKIKRYLSEGKVVIIADFPNLSASASIKSDTAEPGVVNASTDYFLMALAAKLPAIHCEIYTERDGLFTAEPQIVPNTGL